MEENPTRNTPGLIALQLRQEAAFGCCRCGYPIIQYHHIIPYANDHHFRPEDMMALCPNCHDAANNGGLTQDEQRRYKANPHNVKRGYASGLLKVNDPFFRIGMGSNLFIGGGDVVQGDRHTLVGLRLNHYGCLELKLRLYDQENRLILLIEDNEWISGNPSPWDINASYQKLKIREKRGQISLYLNLMQSPTLLNARLWWKGHLIAISPSSLRVDRNSLDCQFSGCIFNRSAINFRTVPETAVEIV